MLRKKFYIPIGFCVVAIVAIGVFILRSERTEEPIKIYKAVTLQTSAKVTVTEGTELSTGEGENGGTSYADGASHVEPRNSQPHRVETAQERFDREMTEKIARQDQRIAELEAQIKTLEARKAEREKILLPILEKGQELISLYEALSTMTPDRYFGLSEAEKEAFFLQCIECDRIASELREDFASLPQWIKDEIEKRRPGTIEKLVNLPLLSELYGRLQGQ